jgi:nucleotide-binding universal stress UspA family protein
MSGITVGIDGSAHSSRALEWALNEAAVRHAPVTVLTVRPVAMNAWIGTPIILRQDPADLEESRLAAEEMTAKAISQLGDAQPSSVTVRAISGFPALALIEASRAADLVVVGCRGGGGFGKLLIGSVSNQVVHHAHCPVVVVPSER